jgi:hypothetical protein
VVVVVVVMHQFVMMVEAVMVYPESRIAISRALLVASHLRWDQ